jgi:hypothetical protein
MQCLPGQDREAIPDKLLISGKCSTSEYFIPSVFLIIEKRVFDMAEMNPYLMRAAGFESAFHKRDIS